MIKNIVFAGTPPIAANLLADLIKSGCQISACFTRPDKPQGRNQQLTFSAVKNTAIANNINIFQPENLKNSTVIENLQQLKPDVMLVFAYGLILPKEILMIPKFGCFNVHTSLLPKFRGAAPVQHAILNGDTVTGISIIQMEAGLDTGDVCYALECQITPYDTTESLYNKLQPLATQATLKILKQLENNDLNPMPQNHDLATYANKFNKLDAKINWLLTAEQIDRIIRAFIPTPVAFTEMIDLSIRIWQASIVAKSTSATPGSIIAVNKDGIDVATGLGVLRLGKLQFPGGKILAATDLLNSTKYKNFLQPNAKFNY